MGRRQRHLDRGGGTAGAGPAAPGARDGDFTLIDITGGNNLQLHVCPSSPHHPHFELLQ
ncbi:hypothetical protein SGM_2352 [Streptomyces griseoaurantiacus M045]|uniref:Uncharacterized protein n=1 Tax=Streptomyces griseoaurantiacus M045 TaxID=996637 RepID=F3NGT8_9ACTN|nr:hypothetical protein [Streptomyces griseoaurantiacus]EGG47428.1 hypothetical protein SGM_2352 [Streptomyces griseoaurantiacus M045]